MRLPKTPHVVFHVLLQTLLQHRLTTFANASLECSDGNIPFVLTLKTDQFPADTTWKLHNVCTGQDILSGGPYLDPSTTYEVSECIPNAAYFFTISDDSGDGICCEYGVGSYTLTVDNVTVETGGDFKASETTSFGSCIVVDEAATVPHNNIFGGRSDTVPNRLIVRFEKGRSESAKGRVRKGVRAKRARRLSKLLDMELLEFDGDDTDTAKKIERLKKNPNIKYVEPDYVLEKLVANDPSYTNGDLWGMLGANSSPANQFGSNAAEAWAMGHLGSHSVVVGVIDEGIDYNHPDLKNNMWVNPFEIPGDGIDNDGNGYVDDIYGWDFYNDDNVPNDPGDDHGTHCAGTIGAVGNNTEGVVGVSWNVKMISGKFLQGSGSTSDAIAAIDYMVDLKVRHNVNIVALSNSWGGGGFSQALEDAINEAGDEDILFVAAAGNAGRDNDATSYYPQGYDCTKGKDGPRGWDCIISVASIQSNGARSSFSSWGATTVDIGAPGSSILSTLPGGGYGTYSGTSMATPHVTGAIALCKSANPSLSAEQIKGYLLQSAMPTSSMNGLVVSNGRLDVGKLLEFCATPCTTSAECNDNYSCTLDTCIDGFCNFAVTPECCGDDICTDLEFITTDSCVDDCCYDNSTHCPPATETCEYAICTDGECGFAAMTECCGDGICTLLESQSSPLCPQDCCYDASNDCPAPPTCRAAVCNQGVCGISPTPISGCCGNGICEASAGETGLSCPADCGTVVNLDTTLQSGNNQNGNFFNIEAKRDAYIKGLDIHVPTGTCDFEVYHYVGSYSGVRTNPAAWTKILSGTVNGAGLGNPTPLPDFLTPLEVLAGSTHAFYVTRTDSGIIYYTNGASEGSVYKEDYYLSFLEGRGARYPFGSTYAPRIWNGKLRYTVEPCQSDPDCDDGLFCNGAETCSSQACVLGSVPVCDNGIFCDGLETCNEDTDSCDPGTPPTCDDDNACTSNVCDTVSDACVNNVVVDCSGEFSVCGVGKICNKDSGICEVEGSAEDGTCGAAETCGTCPNDCSSQTCPPLEPVEEFQSTFAAGTGQRGNMFDIKAKKSIVVQGVDIHVPAGNWSVEVYTYAGPFSGVRSDSAAWTQVLPPTWVLGAGSGNPTQVPDFAVDVPLAAESTQAFYVTLTSGTMSYTRGSVEGAVYGENDDLIFYEGIGVCYSFGSCGTFSPRVWNGRLRYQTFGAATTTTTTTTTLPPTTTTTTPEPTTTTSTTTTTPEPTTTTSTTTTPPPPTTTTSTTTTPPPPTTTTTTPTTTTTTTTPLPTTTTTTTTTPLPPTTTTTTTTPPTTTTTTPTTTTTTTTTTTIPPPTTTTTMATTTTTTTLPPTMMPSSDPSLPPSSSPSSMPSAMPSSDPSLSPSLSPSSMPSVVPSTDPSLSPSSNPSSMPSMMPSSQPSTLPSSLPSTVPSLSPSNSPSAAPFPSAPTASETEIDFSSFDTSWNGWVDGGSDARRAARDIPNCPDATTRCVRLRDNSGAASSITKNFTDVSKYDELHVFFYYRARSFESGEDFFLEYKDANAQSGYTAVGQWTVSANFNNEELKNDTVVISNGGSLARDITLRFRCDASGNNDQIFIDNVTLTGLID